MVNWVYMCGNIAVTGSACVVWAAFLVGGKGEALNLRQQAGMVWAARVPWTASGGDGADGMDDIDAKGVTGDSWQGWCGRCG